MINRLQLFQIIITVLLIITCCEKERIIFKEIDFEISKHILPEYFVKSIDFDSKGNAWIGTYKQGLIKYDGKNITLYDSSNSPLPKDAVIYDITVDNFDNVWIGTYGLLKFDGDNFEFFNSQNSPLLEDFVSSIVVDKNNVIWLVTCRFRQGGLMTLNGSVWKSYTPENSLLPVNLIYDIVVDNENNVWIAMSDTKRTLIKINDEQWYIYDKSYYGFTPYSWGTLAIGKNNILIASIDYGLSSAGPSSPFLVQYDGFKWEINDPVDENGEPLGWIKTINTDLEGNIWVSFWSYNDVKLAVYNGQKWYCSEPGCPIESVFTIESDFEDNIWIGTGHGIYIVKK